MKQTWIILGASSAMAKAFARLVAGKGADLILCGRDHQDLEANAIDCLLRGSPAAQVMQFDSREPATFAPIINAGRETGGMLNVAVFASSMPPQSEIDNDPQLGAAMILDNFSGPMQFLHAIAPILESQKGGTVIGVGSVAGDRGRIKNYVYGATKAAFHTYLSGLRNRLGRSGAHVITVKPGFVDTAMSWGNEGMFLVAGPDDVAADLWKAVAKKRNTIYTPWFWRWIMAIIVSIPEFVFKKLSI